MRARHTSGGRRLGAVVGVLAAATCAGIGPVDVARAAPASAAPSAIRHLVVMTQSGRSFDNYFGARPGVDGIPAGACQLPSKVAQPSCVRPFPITALSQQRQLRTTADIQMKSVNRGGMNGFVRAQTTLQSDGVAAVGYFRPQTLPVLNELADHGVLFDHWFSGVPGGTVANRLFDLTAQSPGDPVAVPTAGWPDTPVIFDRLTAAGVSWRIYVQNYEPALTVRTASTKQRLGGQLARVPLLAMNRYLDDPALSGHIVDLTHYYDDLAAGRLPAVSYIVSTSSTEQSPQDPRKGHQLIRAVVNSLLSSTAWPHSAFLLQYDSSGGWYDHVRPPQIAGATVGSRVPALVISPFVTPGTVDHTRFDAASSLRLIEDVWGLAPLADRDRLSGDLTKAFDFERRQQRPALVDVPTASPLKQPDRATLYAGYATVIALATATILFVLLTTRRDQLRLREVTP